MTLLAGTHSIETERLFLRRIEPADIDYYARIQSDPDVARYIAHGRPRSRAESEAWLDATLSSYGTSGLGQLAVLSKADGVLVGRCGLSDSVVELAAEEGRPLRGWFFRSQAPEGIAVQSLPELGYTFGKESWGKGYASEASEAVFRYVRDHLRLSAVMSVIHIDNRASLAVASKHGVTYGGKLELSGQLFDRYDWPLL